MRVPLAVSVSPRSHPPLNAATPPHTSSLLSCLTAPPPPPPLAVQILKESELAGGATAKSRRPRALVLGPTRELTDQILQVGAAHGYNAQQRRRRRRQEQQACLSLPPTQRPSPSRSPLPEPRLTGTLATPSTPAHPPTACVPTLQTAHNRICRRSRRRLPPPNFDMR